MNLYEIHISVNISCAFDEIKWINYCKYENFKRIRVLNDRGKQDEQHMIAKWCSRNSNADVIAYAKEIAVKMKDKGFSVQRVKVEGMMNSKQFNNVILMGDLDIYWEFHLKIIDTNGMNFDTLRNLVHSKKRKEVAISMSSSGSSLNPIVTIRKHTGSRSDAIALKNTVISEIKAAGFRIHGKIHAECSIYDDNPEEDMGWFQRY